jgi:AcrR family transcriptional regulator
MFQRLDQDPMTQPVEKEPVRPARRARTTPRNADATRDQILAAATEEFADKGLYGARVEEIAARTATSKHMIYYYFGSKDGLYAAALERAYGEFRTVEAALDYDALEPLEAMRMLAGSTFDTHLSRPHVVRILMSENLDRGRHVREINHGIQRALVLSTMSRILQRGVAAGLFRSDIDPLQFHMSLSALSFYYVSNAHTFSQVFDHDMTSAANIALRREEVIETMLARCRA